MNKVLLLVLGIFCLENSHAQIQKEAVKTQENFNWFNKDFEKKKFAGTNVDKAYKELLSKEKVKKTIVVAVIDSGFDLEHEDMQGKFWQNEDEIAGNGIDDDKNGYVDDVNGWNFLGNADGENIRKETYEMTRLVAENRTDSPFYEQAKAEYKSKFREAEKEQQAIERFSERLNGAKRIIKQATGVEVKQASDLKKVVSDNPDVMSLRRFLEEVYKIGYTEESHKAFKKRNDDMLKYHLNVDYTPRADIIGDNPEDITDTNYGNGDLKASRANHGTSTMGVIAADRNNNLGIKGIAENVKIMAIRAVPSGDERDKDIALAIRYAVDNGADLVNMSFGKKYSLQKQFVDDAIKYAQENGVLLIHAAGNNAENVDEITHYPSPIFDNGNKASNFLTVGASSSIPDKNVAGFFSNYGKTTVDIFAPGVNVISTDTTNVYSMHNGTSLAAPVVTGVAALILSYYPDFTPEEIIDILKETASPIKKPRKVLLPNVSSKKAKKIKFADLSTSGGIVNAYAALVEAKKRYKKR